ncbi:hypothetical protein F5884DRAFT_818084 [Xylogone sp. PMI_703]|nr:hypothetical protein F5884DRAFT_818084 [Xylogone sp. PMI_703]
MPFGIHKHSNRSKQALNDSAGQGSTSPSSGRSASPSSAPAPAPDRGAAQPPAFVLTARNEPQSYATLNSGQISESEQPLYHNQAAVPTRSQSTRYSSNSYPQHPALVQAGASTDNLALEAHRSQHQDERASLGQVPSPEHKKRSIFDRMRPSSNRSEHKHQSTPSQSSTYNNTGGLARRLSKRQEAPPVIRTVQQRNPPDQQLRQDWQSQPAAHGSRSQLPSPQEAHEDDGGIDPYQITDPSQVQHYSQEQELGQHQTIRTVPGDSDEQSYEEARKRYSLQPQQQDRNSQIFLQGAELSPQISNQQSHQIYTSAQGTLQPGNLVTRDSYQMQNIETVSQISHDSPIYQEEEQRPISVQSNGQSPTSVNPRQDHPNRTSSRPLSQVGNMAGQGQGQGQGRAPQQARRPGEPEPNAPAPASQPQSDNRGPPPEYRREPPTPGLPTGVSGSRGSTYQGGPPQRDQFGPNGGGEQGRNTPPPAPDRDVNDAYKELLQKYKKVKGLYFEKTAQVEQLQNTLANQRLSQSRTSLDDSEYMTRFQRLDGAITNLAFNIRKDWSILPPWLAPYVNADAIKIGKQEMTAVGRTCITRFLVNEVFNRSFHPGLDSDLSANLKIVEQNIRLFSPALNNQEESDALTAKVIQWRLATLDGLRDVLSSPESEENKKQFIQMVTSNLAATLINHLIEPPPAGIEDSAHMIVELAVSIAANLPLESRDISIVYPIPGDPLQPHIMKVETGIPPLENPTQSLDSGGMDGDSASTGSGGADKDDSAPGKDTGGMEKGADGKSRRDKSKTSSMLLGMMGGGVPGAPGPQQKKNSISGQGGAEALTQNQGQGQAQNQQGAGQGEAKKSSEDGPQKVRFAGFVGVEVRGRQMLLKAPVWAVAA